MFKVDVAIESAEQRQSFPDQDRYVGDDDVRNQSGTQKRLNNFPAINIGALPALATKFLHQLFRLQG